MDILLSHLYILRSGSIWSVYSVFSEVCHVTVSRTEDSRHRDHCKNFNFSHNKTNQFVPKLERGDDIRWDSPGYQILNVVHLPKMIKNFDGKKRTGDTLIIQDTIFLCCSWDCCKIDDYETG